MKPKEKVKKQFRLYDVYRYAATGQMSNIAGLVSYECNDSATVLVVRFEDRAGTAANGFARNFFIRNEQELKQVIKEVNAQLNNCIKPGRKKWRNEYVTQ